MEMMREFPDNHFELAIVDPPYGIGCCVSGKSTHLHKPMTWNNESPKQEYFDELKRVSINQIIWGANYYKYNLPPGRIIHDKTGGKYKNPSSLSDADIASQSFNNLIKIYRYTWRGNHQGDRININNSGKDGRIHPTQKPVNLYEQLLNNYAKPGDKILDTHMGSGSIAIACHYLGFNLTACELDKEYYDAACKRIDLETRQLSLI